MTKILILFYILLPNLAWAAEDSVKTSSISSDYMAKLLLSLGLVVAIIFALAWMVKRFNFLPQQSQGLIKIISTLSVGSRDRLALIQVGEEQLLIALTPGKISKLHSLKHPVGGSIETDDSTFKKKFDDLIDIETDKNKKNSKEMSNE